MRTPPARRRHDITLHEQVKYDRLGSGCAVPSGGTGPEITLLLILTFPSSDIFASDGSFARVRDVISRLSDYK
jgi:hypothetical protein